MGKREHDHESDTELWERVARTTRPLHKGRSAAKTNTPKPRPKPAAKESTPSVKPRPHPTPKQAPVARGEALDRETARKLERGRLLVEARLDLHGMRQRDAHVALRRFLKSAQAKGYRNVLVITGKGAEPDSRRSFFYEEDERGVLRQAVPHWLAAPDLASVVVSFAPAPRRLGGEGALYVRLRRPAN